MPKYNFMPEIQSRQGQGWEKRDAWTFVVMFPGMFEQKPVGSDAVDFLRNAGVWRYVQPAFDEAAKAYEGLVPAVCMDNGLKTS